METSLFLAQLFGASLAIFALAGLLRKNLVKNAINDYRHNVFLELVIGFMSVLAGLSIILTHNVWVMDWPVIVTVFGWSALIKGAMFMTCPDTLFDFGKKFYSSNTRIRAVLIIALALGIFLAMKGFGLL